MTHSTVCKDNDGDDRNEQIVEIFRNTNRAEQCNRTIPSKMLKFISNCKQWKPVVKLIWIGFQRFRFDYNGIESALISQLLYRQLMRIKARECVVYFLSSTPIQWILLRNFDNNDDDKKNCCGFHLNYQLHL